jgi:starvation-inducible DNA-binding protein
MSTQKITGTPMVSEQNASTIVKSLNTFLADSYALLQKSHIYHWNVEGANFVALHQLFEEQYNDLFAAVDEIAERIRAIGAYAPTSLKAFADGRSLSDTVQTQNDQDMIADLLSDHRALAKAAIEGSKLAADNGDNGTEDLLIARRQVHEKAAWMLQSLLK